MSNVTYERVNWEDSPSENTPINQTNLNKMDKGIADCAAAVNNAQSDIENLTTGAEQMAEDLNDKTSLKLVTDTSKQIRFGVDANGNYGYIKDGADSVIPFKQSRLLGTYSSNTTINVSNLSNFKTSDIKIVSHSINGLRGSWSAYGVDSVGGTAEYIPASLSLSGNLLSITAPILNLCVGGGIWSKVGTYDVWYTP